MTARAATGKAGEDYAAKKLEERGYTVLARNYHSRYGEIDIIAENGAYLVFVEVKARKAGSLAAPLEAVTPQKQRRIILTAQAYLAACPTGKQPRFDVAALTLEKGRVVGWEYIENAFLTE